jgi:branched-chain amino acid transport system substrate-binding protein
MRLSPLIAALAAMLLAACGGPKLRPGTPTPTATPEPPPPISIPAGGPLVIGVSVALSGDQDALGRDIADAAALSAAEFAPAFAGHAIEVRAVDDGCNDPERAAATARDLVATRGLIGVIGPMCTTAAQAAGRIYEAAGVMHISPSVTRSDISEQGARYFARTAWRDDAQAAVQARYLRERLAVDRAVVIDDSEPYGNALADAFAAAFPAAGGDVTRERVARGTTDFGALAMGIRARAPHAVVYEGLNPEGLLILKALRDAKYDGIFLAGDGLLSARDYLAQGGAVTEGTYVTGGPMPDPALVLRFAARTGRTPTTPFVVQAYDAVTALLRAVQSVGVERDGALAAERGALAEAVRAQRFAGVSGDIAFDERGDRVGTTRAELGIVVYRVTNGAFVPAE